MSQRTIYLAPAEPKCIGSSCNPATPCARRDVVYTKGRPLEDFSRSMGWFPPACSAPGWLKHISHADAVKPAAAPVVKEWIGAAL